MTHKKLQEEIVPEEENDLQILVSPMPSTFATGQKAEELLADAATSFSALGSALRRAGEGFWESLNARTFPAPAEVEMSLSLALEVGGKWIVVSGKANANVSVKLKWEPGTLQQFEAHPDETIEHTAEEG